MFGWRQEGKVGMEEDGWEGKRVVEVMVVEEQMGIRTKNNQPRVWRKTILAPDDEVTL